MSTEVSRPFIQPRPLPRVKPLKLRMPRVRVEPLVLVGGGIIAAYAIVASWVLIELSGLHVLFH